MRQDLSTQYCTLPGQKYLNNQYFEPLVPRARHRGVAKCHCIDIISNDLKYHKLEPLVVSGHVMAIFEVVYVYLSLTTSGTNCNLSKYFGRVVTYTRAYIEPDVRFGRVVEELVLLKGVFQDSTPCFTPYISIEYSELGCSPERTVSM